jgi:hypothetical protein
MKPPTQTEIGRELGLSKAAVSKLKARGMPCSSADAARRWRARHLEPGRIRPDPGPSPRTLVDRVHELHELAAVAHRIGRFDLVADALRSALRDVPQTQRAAVRLAPALWVALVGPSTWHAIIDEDAAGFRAPRTGDVDASPPRAVGMGVYGVASGELVP